MCNTWWNDFLQLMKNVTLNVKKLTKKLILRALRQLYAASVINILIWWVTPPPNVKFLKLIFFKWSISSQCIFLQNSCSSLWWSIAKSSKHLMTFICLGRLWFLVLNSIHLFLNLQFDISSKWMWSDPSPSMLNSTQTIHKFFICVLIWNSFKIFTVSLSAEEFANGTFNSSYPNFRLCRSNRSASHDILIYSPTI